MPKMIENLREKLIAEGKNILLEKNYSELNIRDIAKNCGIGTGTFYNYFSNKEELVSSIFVEDWNKTLSLVKELKDTHIPFKEKIRHIYKSLENFLDSYIAVFYEIAMLKGYEYKEKEKIDMLYQRVEELIELERQNGSIKSTLDSKSLSIFIVSNLTFLSKTRYISFDELYENMII